MTENDSPTPPPRPGTQPSAPSASHYATELPYPEELQAWLEGKYQVESFLGQGGMGAVYRGLQLPLKRPVAIKILQKQQVEGGDDFDFEGRFKREAYAMAALTHPHIVQVYDCGDAGEGFLFISMELLEGGDLSDMLKAGAIPPETALKLICQICEGLQAAHERGIVHRDIKPANIFLTADGRAKVADFGLAKKFDVKSTFMTKTGLGMGTPDYAAPEQYEPEMGIDHRADIYALGVMMYQMLTGRLPRGVYKMPSQLVAGLDARVDDIVARAMMSEREERWQSAAEIKAAIGALSSPVPTPKKENPTRPVSAANPGARMPRPSRVISQPAHVEEKKRSGSGVMLAVLGAAVVGLGAFFVLKKPSAEAVATSTASSVLEDKTSAPQSPGARSTAPPPQPRKATAYVPANDGMSWIDALAPWWADPRDADFDREPEGAMRATKKAATLRPRALSEPLVDQAVRATVRGEAWGVKIRYAKGEEGSEGYAYGVHVNKNNSEVLAGYETVGKTFGVLRRYPWPAGFDWTLSHTLEVRMVGSRLSITLDGNLLDSFIDNRQAQGYPRVFADLGAVVERFEYLDLGGNRPSPVPAPASPPIPTPPVAVASTPLPPAPTTPKEIIDALAIIDPIKDRTTSLRRAPRANQWEKNGSLLIYRTDGAPGRISAPVALNDAGDYEVGLLLRRLSGSDPFVLVLPVSLKKQAGLEFNKEGVALRVGSEQLANIGSWPASATGDLRIVTRVRYAPDKRSGSVSVTVNGQAIGEWLGALAEIGGMDLEFHPEFAGKQILSFASAGDSFAIAAWQYRVYEGEAQKLREPSAVTTTQAPAPAAVRPPAKAPMNLFDGRTLDGWRIGGDPKAFEVENGAIKGTGAKGNLIFVGDGKTTWTDFDLSLKVKTGDKANSGIFLHCSPTDVRGGQLGLEVQIANNGNIDPQKTGSIWGIVPYSKVEARDGHWFNYRVVVKGKQLTTYVDGKKIAEWTQPEGWQPPVKVPSARLGSGTIAFQSNAGEVWLKEILILVP